MKIALLAALLLATSVHAKNSVNVQQISLELARDVAMKAVDACRAQGYNVAAVVVDRSGRMQVGLRDTLASHFTIGIAERKANAVILAGVSSAEFRKSRADVVQEMNLVPGVMFVDGGLPIRAAGALLGAIGISGAPGSDKDEACAAAALASVQERLELGD